MSKLPTVAIVGQTNVGKSSLFNRFMKSRQAIVAREAGTTRDNVVRQMSYRDKAFWLVDTAGLKSPEDEFEAKIQDQIDDATDLADLILVVVDGTKYPDDSDRLIAKKALKSKKPVVLLVNKSDLRGRLELDEFKRLGIKNIIPTSAEHGIGIHEALESIVDDLPKTGQKDASEGLKIALIGRPNVGKSQLFNTLAKKQQAIVANVAGTTRDVNRLTVRYHDQDIQMLDTAGIRKSGKQQIGIEKFSVLRTLSAIEESDICLLLMDVNEYATQLDQKLAGIIADAGKGLIIVISKWDNLDDKTAHSRDRIAAEISSKLDFVSWATLIFTSSVTGQNVTKIFDLALDINKRRQQKVKTRILNDCLQSSLVKHAPAGLKNTHPKLRYIVQTDTNPPWFVIYGSHLKFLHWSYKRYLERQIRQVHDYSGTPIKFSFIDEKQIKANKLRQKMAIKEEESRDV